MSVASSAASCRDVVFQGETVTLEAALSQTIKMVQRALNDLERNLEQLAMLEEQFLDDSDFRRGVELEDSTCDLVEMLNELLSELVDISADIRGPCPPSQKVWWKEHKLRRKTVSIAKKEAAKQAAAELKAQAALAKAEAAQAAS